MAILINKRFVADLPELKNSMMVLIQKPKFTLQTNVFNIKNYSGHAE